MTDAQKRLLKIQGRQSEIRQKLNDLLAKDERSDAENSELETLTAEAQKLEPELRAALQAAQAEEPEPEKTETLDPETRERLELRARATVTGYVQSFMRGQLPTGAEAEYAAACGADGIPLDLFDEPETREAEQRADAATGAPSTVGVNLQPIRPAVFAASIAPTLGIEMPRVQSGTFAEARISTNLTAGSHAKGSDAEATAAAFTVETATPKRVSGRLGIRIEDVATIGVANFESALRANLMLVMSDELDDQILNASGGNSGADLEGMFHALTDPSAPGATAAKFDDFVAAFADGIDGLWASRVAEVAIIAGVETYKLSAKTFRDATGQDLGDVAFSDYARNRYGGWRCNARMPAAVSNIQQAILHRRGRTGLRTAVCPHWGSLNIDDVYTGSASGTRYVTFHVLLGDVILVQPAAYSQVSFRVAAD